MKDGRDGAARGFTLVELMVVMSIIALLAGLVLPQVTGSSQRGQGAVRGNDVKIMQAAVERFVAENPQGKKKGWPTSDGRLPTPQDFDLELQFNGESRYFKVLNWDASFKDPTTGKTKVFGQKYVRRLPPSARTTRGPQNKKAFTGPPAWARGRGKGNGGNGAADTGWPQNAVWLLDEKGMVLVNLKDEEY